MAEYRSERFYQVFGMTETGPGQLARYSFFYSALLAFLCLLRKSSGSSQSECTLAPVLPAQGKNEYIIGRPGVQILNC